MANGRAFLCKFPLHTRRGKFFGGGRGCFQFAELLQDVRSFVPLSSSFHVLRVGGVGDFITNSPSQKAKLADFDLNEFVGIFAQLFSLINFKAGL